MGHNDHIDFELFDRINELVAEDELDEKSAAYGIAMQVVHTGYDSLTSKQRFIYDRRVIPAMKRVWPEPDYEPS